MWWWSTAILMVPLLSIWWERVPSRNKSLSHIHMIISNFTWSPHTYETFNLSQVMRACNDVKKMYKEKGHLILLQELSDNIFSWKNKYKLRSFWRAGGTQAKISTEFGQNGLCMLTAIELICIFSWKYIVQ